MPPPTSEDLAVRLPALRTLIGLGYTYVPASEHQVWRGGSNSNVILEAVLREKIRSLATG